jgi:cell wall-associated NlpC family hydrolase
MLGFAHPRPRATRTLLGGVVASAALACVACGSASSARHASSAASAPSHSSSAGVPKAHPHAVEPVAGAGSSTLPAAATVKVDTHPGENALARPTSLVDVRRQLRQSGMSASPNQGTLTSDLLAIAPVDAPAAVQEVIAAGNQISHLPYIWGGGHMTYEDTGYDCSGSLSYVLAAAGLLNTTMTSGQLMSWGDAGPGKWITVYASPGHTFMYVAGLRFDTVALAESGSRWSNRSADEPDLSSFVARHPPGL